MMTAPAPVKSYLDSLTSVPGGKPGYKQDLYTVTMADGTVYRWTTADLNVTTGGNTFAYQCPILRRTNVRKTSRLEIDNLEVILSGVYLLSGKAIALMSIQRAFAGARLKLDLLIGPDYPTAASWGPIGAWYEGRFAGTRVMRGGEVSATIESEFGYLDRVMRPIRTARPTCCYALYDANCTLSKAAFTDTATVSGSPTTTQIQTTAAAVIAKANGYYELGVVTFTSGAQAGQRRAVRTFTVSGGVATIVLALPLAAAPAAADAFSIYPGCDRSENTCNTKFSNLVNFPGTPHVPATEGAV